MNLQQSHQELPHDNLGSLHSDHTNLSGDRNPCRASASTCSGGSTKLHQSHPASPTTIGTETGNPSWTHPWTHSRTYSHRNRPGPTTGPTPVGLMPMGPTTGTHSRGTHACGTHAGTHTRDLFSPGPTPGRPGPTLGSTPRSTGPILEAHDPLLAPLLGIEPPLQSQDQHLDPLPISPQTPLNSVPSSTLGLLVSDILDSSDPTLLICILLVQAPFRVGPRRCIPFVHGNGTSLVQKLRACICIMLKRCTIQHGRSDQLHFYSETVGPDWSGHVHL
jgi:hypothetical protein